MDHPANYDLNERGSRNGSAANLHALVGNPPNTDTGRVGEVGHIHLICISKSKLQRSHKKTKEKRKGKLAEVTVTYFSQRTKKRKRKKKTSK